MIRPYSEAQSDNMEKHIIFNIGRQFGSGGKGVAAEISRRLDIKVYDSELLMEAAAQSGISPELFRKQDEKRSLFTIANIFGANRYGAAVGSGLTDAELFKVQSDTIRNIAAEQSAIFVGRASDYVLRDLDCCLDVFISAPVEDRARRVSERECISMEDAEALVRRNDRNRKEYYDYFTFGDWGTASNYDLCIDSSVLGIEGTAEAVIDFARRKGLL